MNLTQVSNANQKGWTMDAQLITRRRIGIAVFLVAICWLGLAAEARGGTYTVRECDVPATGSHFGSPDLFGDNFGGYSADYYCGSSADYGGLTIAGNQAVIRGHYFGWNFQAATGTRFLSGHADIKAITNNAGHVGRLSLGNGSQLLSTPFVGSTPNGDWQRIDWTAPGGDTRQLVMWEQCEQTTDYCPGNFQGYAFTNYIFGRQFVFNMVDEVAPTASALGGTLMSGGWKTGTPTVSVSGSDVGVGLQNFYIYANGGLVGQQSNGCGADGNGHVPAMTPCPSSDSKTFAPNLGAGSFVQGANSIQGCVYDYATANANGACSSAQSVLVDSIAPAQVSGMTASSGESWQPARDFDISWSLPAGESAGGSSTRSPITGARYRIQGPGGYDQTFLRSFNAGDPTTQLNDVMVGTTPGAYTVKVHLIDSAGNETAGNDASANLRYDPTVPPAAEAQFNGWIRRNDFDYTADWDAVPSGQLGPSGLEGYAVAVTQEPTTDPCVTDGDPSADCSAAEVNNDGINDTDMPVGEKGEGGWFIHVVPVTGAGVKAPVQHTPMPVDKSDPESSISGASGQWTNQSVTVGVAASDPLSGMAPISAYASDPQPRTCMQVLPAPIDCEPDADLSRIISTEGEHTVRYFARDLAGNENNGNPDSQYPAKMNHAPNSAAVRIDKTAPQLAFDPSRDVNDPAKIVASATDSLSGVAGGTIELRRQGSSGSWVSIQTALEGSNLVGRVPDDIDPGRYEFRVSGTDRAGNSATSTKRADGSTMVEELPLKEGVNLSATIDGAGAVTETKPKCKGKGPKTELKKKCCKKKRKGKKCKPGKGPKAATTVTVPYGTQTRLKGVLRTMGDSPLRGRTVTVTERMAEGGQPATRSKTTSTDGDGAYAIDLEAGPSRTVTVSFDGDQRYRPTSSGPVDLAVQGKVLAFRSTKLVPETKSIRFKGRVGTAGVDMSAQGKRIELQYLKSRKSWKTIDSGQTRSDGGFKLRYALRSNYVRKTAVKFRISVPVERAWPYVGTATSRARKTVILP